MTSSPLRLGLAIALGLASAASIAADAPAGKPELGSFGVDLSARDLDHAARIIAGTARSMGLTVME